MDLKKLVETVENSNVFKEWIKEHEHSFLCGIFIIFDANGVQLTELNFYDTQKDEIDAFNLGEEITLKEGEEIFRDAKFKIKELKLSKVKVSLPRAASILNKLLASKYKHKQITKKIITLQNLEKELWNIVCITSSFEILHVKIDAVTGKILGEKIESILNFKKVLKKP